MKFKESKLDSFYFVFNQVVSIRHKNISSHFRIARPLKAQFSPITGVCLDRSSTHINLFWDMTI